MMLPLTGLEQWDSKSDDQPVCSVSTQLNSTAYKALERMKTKASFGGMSAPPALKTITYLRASGTITARPIA